MAKKNPSTKKKQVKKTRHEVREAEKIEVFEKVTAEDLNRSMSHSPHRIVETGVLPFDQLFNGEGLPLGIFIEVSSDTGVGKTTLISSIARNLAKRGHGTVYFDAERGFNKNFIDGVGLTDYLYDPATKPDGLFRLYHPKCMEHMDSALALLIQTVPNLSVVVIDSLTVIQPAKLIKEGIGSLRMGEKAALEAQFLHRYKSLNDSGNRAITFIIISQMRTKFAGSFITYRAPAGGEALGFTGDVRLRLSKKEQILQAISSPGADGKKELVTGGEVWMWASKSRWTRPESKVVVPIIYGKGVSNSRCLMEAFIRAGLFTKSGSAHYHVDNRIATEPDLTLHGEQKALQWITNNLARLCDYAKEQGLLYSISRKAEEELEQG